MSAFVLVQGVLYRAEQKTSKAGKPFVVATIRAKDGEGSAWWKIIVFSESAQAELLRLQDGDALAVQGVLKVETYDKGGETKVSLSLIADSVLALKQPRRSAPKQGRKSDAERPAPKSRPPAYDDDIPF
jgi:single-stranded DNA-binding protein